ncbi:MAG: dihydrofolate synthase/folylpolyglutamate synthase [Cocleimonas sp.]|jgi:dihydrofolate synthase/folylpolyglutamate synthase
MKKTLDNWLLWQESLHFSEIDLGLERIGKVAKKLDLLSPNFPIITVAGTNGKGSTVAFLDSILRAEGYKTGAYTSPHLIKYNERIVLNGEQVDDESIIQAFKAIDDARCAITDDNGDTISLTYFEFSTLAAMFIYQQQNVDVAVLEVGLGGRLDAANLWNTSLAIITSIGVDHIDWLGDDRDIIAIEKSGIMRNETPAICGDNNPPKTIESEADRIGAELQQINTDFSFNPPDSSADNTSSNQWQWNSEETSLTFELPFMPGEFQLNNAATAIAGLFAIKSILPVSQDAINSGLKSAQVIGRLQVLQTKPEWLIDVAHNPHAAKQLAKYIKQNPVTGKTYALFSMLRDKDITEVINIMGNVIDEWHIVATKGSRGLTLSELEQYFDQRSEQNMKQNTLTKVKSYDSFKDACETLKNITKGEDRVVAFGSFLVISEILDNCK